MELWRFSKDGAMVERACLLFEAGNYPDKGVTVSEADLQTIAANSDEEIPVRIEHLAASPFDGALGVVTGLRAIGAQLWGTLRQPLEAWKLAQKAGARALSVGLDVAGKRIVETSFVCQPRIANAQVFGTNPVVAFTSGCLFADREAKGMGSVRQFAEGLITYLRGVAGTEEASEEPISFAEARAQLAHERNALRTERIEQQLLEWKREGRLRATEQVEGLARLLLTAGETNVTAFDGKSAPLSAIFSRFVQENGPVVPMGERMPTEARLLTGGASAGERLAWMARERAKQGSVTYSVALAEVTGENPQLSRAAREE